MKRITIHLITRLRFQQEVQKLYGDPYVKNRKGIFEYILGGSVDTKLLDVRVFDDATKKKCLFNTNR
jgi:hypothetical protein